MKIIPTLQTEAYTPAAEDETGEVSFLFDFAAGDFRTQNGKVITVTEKDKLKVWIEKLIRTELNQYPVYEGTEYGVAFPWNTIGVRDRDYIRSEITAELRRKLLENPKITDIRKLSVEFIHRTVRVTITLVTSYDGEVQNIEYYY